MRATLTTTETAIRPVTYRLPKPGTTDPHWGCSRAHYYELDKRLQAERGEKLLIRSCAPGKTRGCTLVVFKVMEAYVLSLLESQGKEAK